MKPGEHALIVAHLRELIANMPDNAVVLVQTPKKPSDWTRYEFQTNYPGEGRRDYVAIPGHTAKLESVEEQAVCIIFIDY